MTKDDLKIIITPEDIYGPGWEEYIPPGWEVDRFGIAKSCEPILTLPARDQDLQYRIILRKKKVKKIVFTLVDKRVPQENDWIHTTDKSCLFRVVYEENIRTANEIYTRTEIEE